MEMDDRSLFDIVSEGDDIVLQQLLLEGKEERNIATLAHGNTLLHEASWRGFSRCVKILCNVYPKEIDEEKNSREKITSRRTSFINRQNFSGFTALHLATQQGHNQTTRELLYAGCSTSIQNDYGDTAMHTSIRYGHAGVLRILISAKCDVDAFNHNHDTPLHLACALGKRKLTKLLIEAGAMFFQNNQNETARDIAKRKNLFEILTIIDSQPDKLDRKLIRESLRKNNQSNPSYLAHGQKKNHESRTHDSPYGCHFTFDSRKFPSPKLQTLPKEPLQKGEIYYMDLAGNIRKGIFGVRNCSCANYSNEAMMEHCKNIQKYVNKANEKLNKKIHELTSKIEKTERRHHEIDEGRSQDPLYPFLKVVGDKNKQIHLESWLNRSAAAAAASLQSPHSSENAKQIAADIHYEPRNMTRESIKVSRSKMMPQYDDQMNDSMSKIEDINDDDSYTDISGDEEIDGDSNFENPLYDEAFIRNFQQQQQHNDSLASPSINSNQNIEMEMQKIAKSLSNEDEQLMVSSQNPDVIRDHIQASAKRSTKKIKSAIVTKPSDLYVNSFFINNDGSDGVNNNHLEYSKSDDEVDSCEIDRLVSKVQQTILWPQADRSRNRNPLPMNFTDKIENFDDDNLFRQNTGDQVQTTLNEDNYFLLNKLLIAREQLSQQLQVMNSTDNSTVDENQQENSDLNPYIPRSSLV